MFEIPNVAPRNSVALMKMRTDSPRPRVASARYAPSRRNEGMAMIIPATPVTMMANGRATQKGIPRCMLNSAEE